MRVEAERQMRADVEAGLSWYCRPASEGGPLRPRPRRGVGGGNETLCSGEGPPSYDCFAAAPVAEQKDFMGRCCLSPESPVVGSGLCRAYRGNLAAAFSQDVVLRARRLGRFLAIELPLYKAVLGWAWATGSRALGLRKRVAFVRLEGVIAAGQV